MVVQNRCYAAFGWDTAVRDVCRRHGIVYQGFSLLTANREVFIDPAIRAIAEKYATGVAQVIFRFAMQIGMVPLTGTTNAHHMADDLRVDRFTLAPDELLRIESIAV
jgi:diketogulonate reductase-like aldo/keto reductase